MEDYYNAEYCTFNSLSLDEKYNSLDEKKLEFKKIAAQSYRNDVVKTFWKDTSIDCLDVLIKKYLDEYHYDKYKKYYSEDLLMQFGFKK